MLNETIIKLREQLHEMILGSVEYDKILEKSQELDEFILIAQKEKNKSREDLRC